MLIRIVSVVSILGVCAAAGCQQEQTHTSPARQEQAQQDTWRMADADSERQRYVVQARRQIEGVYHAAGELEQVAGRFGVAEQFAPYRQKIIEHLQAAQDRVFLVEQIDQDRLDVAVGYLAEAIDGLFDAYNDAAIFIQRYLDTE